MEQKKRGRPHSENPMVHTAVVLPRKLLDRLKGDAEAARNEGTKPEGPPLLSGRRLEVPRAFSGADRKLGKGDWERSTFRAGKRLDSEMQKPSGRGLSTEIRRRLQLTYDWEGPPGDPETRDLVGCIQSLADNLARDLGKKWHEHPYALAAFKAGVASFLAQYQPEGDANVRPDTGAVGAAEDPPDAVGRTHARLILSAS